MTSAATARPVAPVRAATRATYTAFIGSGFVLASWAARIPQIKEHLRLTPSALGLVLLAMAAGSVVALPLSGTVVTRLGSRRTVTVMAVLLPLGLVTAAVGYLLGMAVVVVGLFILGFANGAWDVAMNVQGAAVERRLGRSIMPRFHAGFSLGTVAGALIGAAAVALHVPVTAHLVGVAIVVAAAVPTSVRRFIPDHGDGDTELTGRDSEADLGAEETAPQQPHRGGHRGTLAAWREPRTLLIGIFVLAFAFAEGTGNDWISVALIDGQHVPAAVGTLGFAAFLAAMTTGRWFGPGLLDRHGRVAVVRGLALLGIAGTALFVFAPVAALGFVGALLWGLGASLGFPVGMSAGADDPKLAAGRVSVIASIGYCAFLGGPPTIGFLGDRFTVLHALAAVSVLLALATLVSTAVAPAGQARSGRSRTRR